jgi:filamentous hemagglutinin family protein
MKMKKQGGKPVMKNYKPAFKRRPAVTTTILRHSLLALGGAVALTSVAFANPTGGVVAAGTATISNAPLTTTINQSSNKAVINWSGFNIAPNETTTFNQPSVNSATLNRIGDANPSQILGTLNANGQVMLVNKNGMFFGKNAQVNVGSLVATTADINNSDFMSGNYVFDKAGNSNASIVNNGTITTADGGYAALAGPSVANKGTINANKGKVALAGGDVFTLDLTGDKLVNFALPSGYSRSGPLGNTASVDNSGKIFADQGTVQLSALAAKQAVDSAINMDGVIRARSASGHEGKITLEADNVDVSGKLNANGTGHANGGTIDAYAHKNMSFSGDATAQGGPNGGNGGTIAFTGDKNITLGGTASTMAPNGTAGTTSFIGGDTFNVNSGEAYSIDYSRNHGGTVNVLANKTINVNSGNDDGTADSGQTSELHLGDRDANGQLTVNLNAKLPEKSAGTLTGDANKVNVASGASVQQGVDVASNAGANVNVAAGTFDENVDVAKNNLNLASTAGATVNGYVNIAGNDDSLSGLTVNGGNLDGSDVGVNITGNGANVHHNTIAALGDGTAVNVDGGSNANIHNNTIADADTGVAANDSYALAVRNNTINATNGIDVKDSSKAAIANNTITGDGSSAGTGVHLDNADNAKLTNNTVSAYQTGMAIDDSDNVTANNNTVSGVTDGIDADASDNLVLNGNTVTGEDASAGTGIHLNDSHNAKVKNNTVTNELTQFSTTGTTTVTAQNGNNF